jgi:hypothetical protein
MRVLHGVAALALVLALVVALAACGGTPIADQGFTTTLYASHEYGFSLKYPADFDAFGASPDAKDPGAPKMQEFFFDAQGTKVDGKSVDILEVAVYQMSSAPAQADFEAHKRDFEAMLVGLIGKVPDLKMVKPISWTTLDGRPAVTLTCTYTIGGKDVAASALLVFKDDRAYLVRAQASRETWATTGRELASSMASFEFL